MQCPSCAASYEDTFKFCPYCGRSKPEPASLHIKVEEPRWEYLKIEEEEGGGVKGSFAMLCMDLVRFLVA